MKMVIDVNIVISALLKKSITREIIVDYGFDLYFPERSMDKIKKYKNYIMRKSGINESQYNEILKNIFENVEIIPDEEIGHSWHEADNIMAHIDREDVVFVAAALSLDSIIWSNDKDFDKQDEIKVLKTGDIVDIMKFFGAWKMEDEEVKEIKKRINEMGKDFGKDFEKRTEDTKEKFDDESL